MEGCGIMLDFNPREYSIRELYDSYKRGETILSPKFQRRPVWDYKAKIIFDRFYCLWLSHSSNFYTRKYQFRYEC